MKYLFIILAVICGSLALAERRVVLFVFAALFTFAIVRSATMKKFFPNP